MKASGRFLIQRTLEVVLLCLSRVFVFGLECWCCRGLTIRVQSLGSCGLVRGLVCDVGSEQATSCLEVWGLNSWVLGDRLLPEVSNSNLSYSVYLWYTTYTIAIQTSSKWVLLIIQGFILLNQCPPWQAALGFRACGPQCRALIMARFQISRFYGEGP